MKKRRIIIVTGLIALGAFAYINVTKTPPAAVQQNDVPAVSELQESTTVIKTGNFKDGDAVHKGNGQASIVKTPDGAYLKFENFSVTAGPDLFVYASPNTAAEGLGKFIVIGELKNREGEQVYNLPDGYEDYKSIVIWCRAFNVTFATADLQ